MDQRSREAFQTIHERPRKSASHGPTAELAYWLSRAEETYRREPTLSKDLRRAALLEMRAVWCCSSVFVRRLIGTAEFFVWIYLFFTLIHGRLLSILPQGIAARALVLLAGAVMLGWLWWGSYVWAASLCGRRAVIGRERLHRWLSMPDRPPTGTIGRWDLSPAPSPASGVRQHPGEPADAGDTGRKTTAPLR